MAVHLNRLALFALAMGSTICQLQLHSTCAGPIVEVRQVDRSCSSSNMPAGALSPHGMRTGWAAKDDLRLDQRIFSSCPSTSHLSLPIALLIEIFAIHLQLIFSNSSNLLLCSL